jgi:DNA replication protein DnaC
MLTEPLIQQLTQLRLHGMAAALEQQANGADGAARSFEDRLGLLIQNELTDLTWIRQHLNLLITGPTGVGKSYLGSALAHAACRADFSVRCFRLPRLVEEFARYAALQRRSALLKQLARVELLVIDDFGLAPLADATVRDLLEVLDDRYDRASTLITSQLPLDQWHGYLGDRTVADAILDRLVHNAHKIALRGESMRKARSAAKRKDR